jgi:hypothetical protein
MSRTRIASSPPGLLALVALLALASAACSAPAATSTAAPTASPLGPRPSSLATLAIAEPADGSDVTGTSAHVGLRLTGATIVAETTTAIRPDQGHVHLYLDNQLVSMNYGLEQDVPVTPGTHVLRAEFVAADHAPFSPRVISADVVFTVN